MSVIEKDQWFSDQVRDAGSFSDTVRGQKGARDFKRRRRWEKRGRGGREKDIERTTGVQ